MLNIWEIDIGETVTVTVEKRGTVLGFSLEGGRDAPQGIKLGKNH